MGMKSTFSQFFGLDDEDELDYYDEIEADKADEVATSDPKKSDNRRQNEYKRHTALNARRESAKNSKVISMNQQAGNQQTKIVIFEPRVYSEVQEIADLLLNNRAVVLNFNRIEEDQAKRVVDFLTGTIYAINGDIQRVGDEIFLCTPQSVEIDGVLTDAMQDRDFY